MTTFSLAFNHISESHTHTLCSALRAAQCSGFFASGQTPRESHDGVTIIGGYGVEFRQSLAEIFRRAKTDVVVFLLKPVAIEVNQSFTDWITAFGASGLPLSYSSHFQRHSTGEAAVEQPTIDYTVGSVRNDFDFGALLAISTREAITLLEEFENIIPDDCSGLYGLRLASTLRALPLRWKQSSYTASDLAPADLHDAHFAYASAAGANSQKAFERTFTTFAKTAGFYVPPRTKEVDLKSGSFPVEASVIIPVRNRAGKVEHAVTSALSQQTDFPFNVIVVDNHSTDGTTEALRSLAAAHSNLVHLIPERHDLGIGGCWQLAVQSSGCGRFAVQLDSDDIYSHTSVLARIVREFHETNAAAVVGSYLLVDRDLNPIPPGAIEHREWSDTTGHNTILRINGLGAPRAFFTPVIRQIGFPNVSYGEDYSAMLAVSRSYRISRIYEHLYLCRRWEGNSDAMPSIEKMNSFNLYKDSLRTNEIEVRRKIVAG